MQHQLHILFLAERSPEQVSVLSRTEYRDRYGPPAFVPISRRYFREMIVSSHLNFLTYFPNLGLQISLFQTSKRRSDFTDSFLSLNLPAAVISVISIAVIPSTTQNSHPPKNTPPQVHLLSWLNKLQLQKLFFSWDFLNQISVFLLASTGVICNLSCHSSD